MSLYLPHSHVRFLYLNLIISQKSFSLVFFLKMQKKSSFLSKFYKNLSAIAVIPLTVNKIALSGFFTAMQVVSAIAVAAIYVVTCMKQRYYLFDISLYHTLPRYYMIHQQWLKWHTTECPHCLQLYSCCIQPHCIWMEIRRLQNWLSYKLVRKKWRTNYEITEWQVSYIFVDCAIEFEFWNATLTNSKVLHKVFSDNSFIVLFR